MVIVYLLCQWANASGAPAAPLTNTIDLASLHTNIIEVWTQGAVPDNNLVFRSKNGGAYALLSTVAGATLSNTDAGPMVANDVWCYKVQAKKGGLTSGFSPIACMGFLLTDKVSVSISFPDLVLVEGLSDFSFNAALVTFSAPKLKKDTTTIDFEHDTGLTSCDLSSLQTVGVDLNFSSCVKLPSLNLAALQTVGGNFNLDPCSLLTSLTITNLQTVGGFIDMTDCLVLTTFSAPALTTVGGDFVAAITGPTLALSTFNCPLLVSVGGSLVLIGNHITVMDLHSLTTVVGEADFINGSWATISLPALAQVQGGGGLMFTDNSSLTSTSCPLLTTIGTAARWYRNPLLASVSVPLLNSVGQLFDFSSSAALVTFNLPALTTAAADASYFGAGSNSPNNPGSPSTTFANLTIPNLVFTDGTLIDFNGCALTHQSCENIVSRAVASPGLGPATTINLTGGTNAALATWSAQGHADRLTLLGQGVVLTNN